MAITISGENNNDKILASDGVIDQISGINIVGVITATSFTGDLTGNVTGNVTGNLTGNVNSTSPLLLQTGGSERFRITGNNELGIAGANYGSSGQVLTSGGSGSAVSWVTPAVTAFTNGSNNRVVTATSGSGLNGEANLTFNGTTLDLNGTANILKSDSSGFHVLIRNTDNTNGNQAELRFQGTNSSNGGYTTARIVATNLDNYNQYSNLRFFTHSLGSTTEKLRITSDGKLLVNHISSAGSGKIQAYASNQDAVDIFSYSTTNTHGGRLTFYRSKNATVGSNTEVADGDSLGRIDWRGYNDDGTTYNQGARIEALVDGAVNSTTDMPTALVFKTSEDGSSTPSQKLRIDSSGRSLFRTNGSQTSAIADDNVPIQIAESTASMSYIGFNKSGSYGTIIGHHTAFGGTVIRNVLSNSDIVFYTNNTSEKLRIESDGHLRLSNSDVQITSNTSDGSDNKRIIIGGGGASGQTRGAQIALHGNEYGGYGGTLQLLTGNTNSTHNKIQMYTDGNERLILQNGGVLTQRVNSNARLSHGILEITSSASPSQLKITTNIPYSGSNGSHAESVTIRGFRYGGRDTVDIQICWHVYAGQFYNRIASSSGAWAPLITLAVENNKVVIHFDSLGYWHKIYVADYYSAHLNEDYARGWTYDFNAISGDTNTPVNTVPYKNDWGGLEYNSDHAVGTNPDRHLKIVNGNLQIGTSGHGIDFSSQTATSASGASTLHEVLDHYEEGTFTPIVRTNNNSTEPSYNHRLGLYTRVGNLVTYVIRITTSGELSTGSGATEIWGLPFAGRDWTTGDWPGGGHVAYYHNLRGAYGTNIRILGPYKNQTNLRFHIFDNQNDTGYNQYNRIFTNNTIIIVNGHYYAA